MRHLIGFSVCILTLFAEPTAVCQLETPASVDLRTANVRIEHDIDVENQPVLEILLDVLRGTGVDGGFAEISGCSDLPKGSLRLKQGATVREAMDALVAANPSYQWELGEGVVNLTPRVSLPLLGTEIGQFRMDATAKEIAIVFQDLLRLPEVREREAALGLKQGPGQGGPGVYDEHPVPTQPVPAHINVQRLSLQGAFNRIVRASRKAAWIYRETDCGGNRTYTVEVALDY